MTLEPTPDICRNEKGRGHTDSHWIKRGLQCGSKPQFAIGISTYRVTRQLPKLLRDEIPIEDLQNVIWKLRDELQEFGAAQCKLALPCAKKKAANEEFALKKACMKRYGASEDWKLVAPENILQTLSAKCRWMESMM